MPDPLFFLTRSPLRFAEIAALTDARRLQGGPSGEGCVTHVAAASEEDLAGAAIFINDAAYLKAVPAWQGDQAPACILVPERLADEAVAAGLGEASAVFACQSARAGFAIVAAALHASRAEETDWDEGDEPQIGEDCRIARGAVIGAGARLGARVSIGANTVIGPGVSLGDDCHVGANAVVTHAIVGAGCRILSCAVVGEAGFGFVRHQGRQLRVPQLGRVVLGTEVEIGANTTIDRGALGDTMIGDSTKIDNLVQVAHNVTVGKGCAFASQVGISGSTRIGDGVLIGGQAGVADHITVGDGAVINARAALLKDVPAGEAWGGYPAKPSRQWLKEVATLTRLSKRKAD